MPSTTDTTELAPTEADFDSWSEEDEKAAIFAAAEGTKIKYIVGDGTFYGRFPDGRVVKTTLRFSSGLLDQITEVAGTNDERTQLKVLLQLLGQDDDVAYLSNADLVSVIDYAMKYFAVFEKVVGISLGE